MIFRPKGRNITMPTNTPRHQSSDTYENVEEGDTVRLHIDHNSRPNRTITATVERTTTFGGGKELRCTMGGPGTVKVYGDHYPPVVEQTGHVSGRLQSIEIIN